MPELKYRVKDAIVSGDAGTSRGGLSRPIGFAITSIQDMVLRQSALAHRVLSLPIVRPHQHAYACKARSSESTARRVVSA